MLEAPAHADRTPALEHDALCWRARQHVATAREHLRHEAHVEALLLALLATLQAVAASRAAVGVALQVVALEAERTRRAHREQVRASERDLRGRLGSELALQLVLGFPHRARERFAAHAALALPALEHIARRAH